MIKSLLEWQAEKKKHYCPFVSVISVYPSQNLHDKKMYLLGSDEMMVLHNK